MVSGFLGDKKGSNGQIDSKHFGHKIAPLHAGRLSVGDNRALVPERKPIPVAGREVEVVQGRQHSDALLGDRSRWTRRFRHLSLQ